MGTSGRLKALSPALQLQIRDPAELATIGGEEHQIQSQRMSRDQ